MPYPIQTVGQSNNVQIWLISTTGTITDYTQYVTSLSITQGDTQPDFQRAELSAGGATLELKNPPSNGSNLAAGWGLVVAPKNWTTVRPQWFAGLVQEITTQRIIDPKTGAVTWMITVEACDFATLIMQAGTIDQTKCLPTSTSSGEYWNVSTDLTNSILSGTDGTTNLPLPYYTNNAVGTNMNFFVGPIDYAKKLQMFADSALQYINAYHAAFNSAGTYAAPEVIGYWVNNIDFNSYTPSGGVSYIATDGTHTTGTPTIKPIEIEYGSTTRSRADRITLNQVGLKRGIYPTGNVTSVENLPYTYSTGQGGNVRRELALDTMIYADNTGWNYIGNTLTGQKRLATASTTYFSYQNSISKTRNNHGSCRVLVSTTYTAGQSINLLDPNDFPDMLTSPAGGTTGNWYFRFYAMAHSSTVSWSLTPGIRWYDVGGTLLSTTSGTAVNITSNTTWTAVTVNAAKPANAVVGMPFFNVGTVNAVGNSFYITDAYFGQQGGYLTYDGDTPDDATYIYSWTGERWNSPTQRNSATPVNTLATNWLTRNTVTNVVQSITLNLDQAAQDIGYCGIGTKIAVWVNAVSQNYIVVGREIDSQPTQTIIKLHLLKY